MGMEVLRTLDKKRPTGPLARPTVGSVTILSEELLERSRRNMTVNWEAVLICLSTDGLSAYIQNNSALSP